MKLWHVRAMMVSDLAQVDAWLPPLSARELPSPSSGDIWLAAHAIQADQGDWVPGPVLGSLRLRRLIGLDSLRHWYHVGCVVHAAPELGVFHRQHTLLLGNDYTGASELAELQCDTASLTLAEQADVLHHLVHTALLILARDRELYSGQLIAELPGLRDASGRSPFWEGLGRHFYTEDPVLAAQRCGAAWRTYVAALLPRQPVYTSFLPPATQAAIAQACPQARVAMEVLNQAGLRYGHHIGIDDAGPVFEARVDTLPGVLGAQRRIIALERPDHGLPTQVWRVLLEGDASTCPVRAEADRQILRVTRADMDTLGLKEGMSVWA